MSEEERWRRRPVLAFCLRLLIVLVPLGLSVLASVFVARHLPVPDGAGATLLWWCAVFAASITVILIGELVARRLLPLVALLRLSLLFPGVAPSRVGINRLSTRAELRRLTLQVKEHGLGDDPGEAARTLVRLIGALDVHDRKTRGHSERVRVYTDLLAERLSLDEGARDRLRWAALMHDIGKLMVPFEVLNKPGRLTEGEWELMHRHPEEGDRMLGGLRGWLGEWAPAIKEHHERWDGSGYPSGLSEENITLGGRIVAVADSYDVMTSVRSYQPKPRSPGAAREELVACSGSQFDPGVVRSMLNLSTRRLWLLLGPLAWAAQVPLLGTIVTQGYVVPAAISAQSFAAVGLASRTNGGVRDFPHARTRGADLGLSASTTTATTTSAVPSTRSTTSLPPTSASIAPPTSASIAPPTSASIAPPTTAGPSSTQTFGGQSSPIVPCPSGFAPPRPSSAPPGIVPTTTTGTAPRRRVLPRSPSAITTAPGPSTTTPPSTSTSLPASTTTTRAGAVPVLRPDQAGVAASGEVDIDVLANDSDPGRTLDRSSVALASGPRLGVAVANGGPVIAYRAAPGSSAEDSFTYRVDDQSGRCLTSTVTIRISP